MYEDVRERIYQHFSVTVYYCNVINCFCEGKLLDSAKFNVL